MYRKSIAAFLRTYGIRLLLLALGLFLLLQKDLTLEFKLRSPLPSGEPAREMPEGPQLGDPAERYSQVQEKTGEEPQELRMPLWWPGKEKASRRSIPAWDGLAERTVVAFIERFGHVAAAEEQKFGLPARFILAHALLVSRAGEAVMSRQGKNYFGLPCTADWTGPHGNYDGVCARHYPNAWTSFRDFSYFLSTGPRSKLLKRCGTDLARWAREVEKEGFDHIQNYQARVLALAEELEKVK